jgi:hypothetical protein
MAQTDPQVGLSKISTAPVLHGPMFYAFSAYAFSVGFITIAENPLTDTKRRRWGVHNSFTYGDSLLGHSGSYITMNVAIVAD